MKDGKRIIGVVSKREDMESLFSLIKFFLLPPMVFSVVAFAALVSGKKYFRLAILTLGIFLLLSLQVVENIVASYWERFPAVTAEKIQQFMPQAIVVIGGGMQYTDHEYGSNMILKTGTLLRIKHAAKLARETGLPVLTSGGQTLGDTDPSEAEIMSDVLKNEFCTPVTWMETQSVNTKENAQYSYDLLKQSGVKKIILVTQAYHMLRAEKEFRSAGFDVLPAPTNFITKFGNHFNFVDWLPSVIALEQCYLLCYEFMGVLWYEIQDFRLDY